MRQSEETAMGGRIILILTRGGLIGVAIVPAIGSEVQAVIRRYDEEGYRHWCIESRWTMTGGFCGWLRLWLCTSPAEDRMIGRTVSGNCPEAVA